MTLILSGTDGLSDVDGSAATPAIRGTDANTGIFFPAADTVGVSTGGSERMRVDSSGNVGIGTSSPSARVDNTGTFRSTGATDPSSGTGLELSYRSTYGDVLAYNRTSSAFVQLQVRGEPIIFGNTGGERMRIDSSGNVGIGTSSPASRLNIATGASTSCTMRFTANNTGTGAGDRGRLDFYSADNSGTAYQLGYMDYDRADGTGTASYIAWASRVSGTVAERMRIDSSGNLLVGTTSGGNNARLKSKVTANTYGLEVTDEAQSDFIVAPLSGGVCRVGPSAGAMAFYASNTECARIDSSGNLLVGTTSQLGSSQLSVLSSQANQMVYLRNSNATPGGIFVNYSVATPNNTGSEFFFGNDPAQTRVTLRSNGGIANYSANNVNLSDRREKTNFAPAKSYLDVICAIPVQTFNYIDQNLEEDDGLTLGVVAQDVQAVAPELVSESDWSPEKDGSKMRLSIYQTDLQYALMKCIQEQQALITALTARIEALENK